MYAATQHFKYFSLQRSKKFKYLEKSFG